MMCSNRAGGRADGGNMKWRIFTLPFCWKLCSDCFRPKFCLVQPVRHELLFRCVFSKRQYWVALLRNSRANRESSPVLFYRGCFCTDL